MSTDQEFINWASGLNALRPALKEFLDAPSTDGAAAVLRRYPGLASPDVITVLDNLIRMTDADGNASLARRNRERRAMLQAALRR